EASTRSPSARGAGGEPAVCAYSASVASGSNRRFIGLLLERSMRRTARRIRLWGRAGGAGISPRLHEGAERRLGSRRWLAAHAGLPRPADELVLRHVLDDLGQAVAAVARGILHLLADLRQRPLLPGHVRRRQPPFRVAGYVSGIEVRGLVAGRAAHRRDAEAVGTAMHGRLVGITVALRRAIAVRVTVQAPWVLQHFARLDEERRGARGRVPDPRERARGAQRAARLRTRHQWRERGRGAHEHGGARDHEADARCHAVLVPAAASRANGRRRTRCPVRWTSAFATAGASGGRPGSPTPVGAAPDGTMCTSTAGISAIRNGR